MVWAAQPVPSAAICWGCCPLKPASGFPAITLCINIAGAFALGLIGALAGKYAKLNPQLLLFLRVGCAAVSPPSTFSVETAGLLQSGKTGLAMLYTALSLLLGVTVVLLGQRLVR